MTFDADSHVEEPAQTWKYLDAKFARRRPIPITLGSDMPHSESHPNSFQKFQERSYLSAATKARILNDNARRFFSR